MGGAAGAESDLAGTCTVGRGAGRKHVAAGRRAKRTAALEASTLTKADLDGQRHAGGPFRANADGESVWPFGDLGGLLETAHLTLAALGARRAPCLRRHLLREGLIVRRLERLSEYICRVALLRSVRDELTLAEKGRREADALDDGFAMAERQDAAGTAQYERGAQWPPADARDADLGEGPFEVGGKRSSGRKRLRQLRISSRVDKRAPPSERCASVANSAFLSATAR